MTATLVWRVVPPVLRSRRPQRMIERSLMVYKRTWLIIASGFFEPLFYLLSMRVGVGELVAFDDPSSAQPAEELLRTVGHRVHGARSEAVRAKVLGEDGDDARRERLEGETLLRAEEKQLLCGLGVLLRGALRAVAAQVGAEVLDHRRREGHVVVPATEPIVPARKTTRVVAGAE